MKKRIIVYIMYANIKPKYGLEGFLFMCYDKKKGGESSFLFKIIGKPCIFEKPWILDIV